jgi:hypothetical protein
VTTVFINRPKADIEVSIRKRGGPPEQVEKRIKHVEDNWKDRPLAKFDYFIWAENLEESIAEFTKMVEETLEPPKA